ncbi:MAG TPA: adenylyltransferase/cytidyltransferase family protein [Candidatus Nanoarchaeia archaeon]|nr:adenylyltransferase/cytidyltransferase family protein [Candidatus Nanoarchaeia archaeon]
MKTIMCFGTFDLLHLGHINYLQQAKRLADFLIVVVARDKTKKQQNKVVVFNENERLELIKNLRIVDEAVLGYPDDHFKIIMEKNPGIIFLGYDHAISEANLSDKLSELGLNPLIKRAKPYQEHKHKSTNIKGKILGTL